MALIQTPLTCTTLISTCKNSTIQLSTNRVFRNWPCQNFEKNWISLFSMLSTDTKFENTVYSKMDITYRFRKINSNVFQNVLMPVFTVNGCKCIETDSRWLDSPLLSAHKHTFYTYNFPRASLASLTYIHRETHMAIVKLHVHPDHIGADCIIHNRDIQILCTLHWGQTLQRKCTKLYCGNLPNCMAAMYQSIRWQYTKLYGGNWRRGRGGTLTKCPGKSRKPKTP